MIKIYIEEYPDNIFFQLTKREAKDRKWLKFLFMKNLSILTKDDVVDLIEKFNEQKDVIEKKFPHGLKLIKINFFKLHLKDYYFPYTVNFKISEGEKNFFDIKDEIKDYLRHNLLPLSDTIHKLIKGIFS